MRMSKNHQVASLWKSNSRRRHSLTMRQMKGAFLSTLWRVRCALLRSLPRALPRPPRRPQDRSVRSSRIANPRIRLKDLGLRPDKQHRGFVNKKRSRVLFKRISTALAVLRKLQRERVRVVTTMAICRVYLTIRNPSLRRFSTSVREWRLRVKRLQ